MNGSPIHALVLRVPHRSFPASSLPTSASWDNLDDCAPCHETLSCWYLALQCLRPAMDAVHNKLRSWGGLLWRRVAWRLASFGDQHSMTRGQALTAILAGLANAWSAHTPKEGLPTLVRSLQNSQGGQLGSRALVAASHSSSAVVRHPATATPISLEADIQSLVDVTTAEGEAIAKMRRDQFSLPVQQIGSRTSWAAKRQIKNEAVLATMSSDGLDGEDQREDDEDGSNTSRLFFVNAAKRAEAEAEEVGELEEWLNNN